ncbi:hypothetical protein [Candidatus Methanomassiliicoccus intestinalis]|uniref:hypothetical protein n=1 Tax=Candidatus Methanomassiliicoccus intestinalis TaxID=1406512 RepID=UPI0037DC5BF6
MSEYITFFVPVLKISCELLQLRYYLQRLTCSKIIAFPLLIVLMSASAAADW